MAPTSATKDQTPAGVDFVGLASPTPLMPPLHVDQEPTTESPYDSMRVNAILYSSAALALLLSAQIGWSASQLNVSTFQDQDDCDARPVAPGTCLMFPGHSKSSWTWVENLWIAGGAVGSIGCAKIADRIGRKKALTLTAILMIVGAIVQATASSLTMYAVGRFVSGVASGAASSVPNSYINEISPPHLRNRLGSLYQISICIAIIFVGLSFFFANTSVGWRYIGGFPVLLAGIFLLGAPTLMVESPAWLLEKGLREEAECEITRLFDERNVDLALSWLNPTELSETTASKIEEAPEHEESAADLLESPWKGLFSSANADIHCSLDWPAALGH
ncbi:hypothetical protein Poli38472_011068 [Pythium oligandrum]|uniref:Major facilitator superfamily (MFS) profile domain-containing protein n=1 Tax=Pythium oligandrum TaxID=41045 RepID=A0A8K1CSD7_PYTOL|nr:hypothetical protein Poli38472_011068 [Pythium oligandrum]|eukprot:TMW67448.1 hypothetical protein Poli38472_011068 [Pythium oligandrum]